jgi:hypothetical protein
MNQPTSVLVHCKDVRWTELAAELMVQTLRSKWDVINATDSEVQMGRN